MEHWARLSYLFHDGGNSFEIIGSSFMKELKHETLLKIRKKKVLLYFNQFHVTDLVPPENINRALVAFGFLIFSGGIER